MRPHSAVLIILVVATFQGVAGATITIKPEEPTTRDAVAVVVDDSWPTSCLPINPVVIREASFVRVHFRDVENGEVCLPALTTWKTNVVIGGLVAGEHRIAVTVQSWTRRTIWTSAISVRPADTPTPSLRVSSVAISPSVGSVPVVIQGENFLVDLECPISDCRSAVPRAWIGPEAVRMLDVSDRVLTGEIPRRNPGRYDLRVERADGVTVVIPDGVTIGRRGFERILIPIAPHGEIAGGYGSRWITSGWGHNGSDFDVDAGDGPFPGSCIATGCPWPVQAGSTFELHISSAASGEGGFYYVEEEFAASFNFTVTVRDVSRGEGSAGTTIPVVRERDTFSGARRLEIPGIPVEEGFRYRLRIYDFDAPNEERVTVRLLGESEDRAGVLDPVSSWEGVIELGGPSKDWYDDPSYPQYPGYAVIDLETLPFDLGSFDKLRVEIEDLTGVRFWAFLSVTDNETQHVTVFAP